MRALPPLLDDRIRGVPGNYKRALATMEALREIRTRDKRLSLSVVSTVMSARSFAGS